jgi:hypothetical protein
MKIETSHVVQAMLTLGNFTPDQTKMVYRVAQFICKEREEIINKEIYRLSGVILDNDRVSKKALADMDEMAKALGTLKGMVESAGQELQALQKKIDLLEGEAANREAVDPTMGVTTEDPSNAGLQATREILKHISAGTDRTDAERYRWACARGMFSVRAADGTYSMVAAVGKAEWDLCIDNGRKHGGMPTMNR